MIQRLVQFKSIYFVFVLKLANTNKIHIQFIHTKTVRKYTIIISENICTASRQYPTPGRHIMSKRAKSASAFINLYIANKREKKQTVAYLTYYRYLATLSFIRSRASGPLITVSVTFTLFSSENDLFTYMSLCLSAVWC